MIIPVRCFSCGKPIGQLWEQYKKQVVAGQNPGKVLDDLGLERFCCRSVFIGQEDYIELISKFRKS